MQRFGFYKAIGLGVLVCVHAVACGSSSSSHSSTSGGSTSLFGDNTGGRPANAGGSPGAAGNSQTSTCSGSFSPCASDPNGSWRLTSVCTTGDVTQAFNQAMADESPACDGMYQSASVTGSGTATFNDGVFTPDVTETESFDIILTNACVSALSGQTVTLDSTLCSAYGQGLESSLGGPITCAFDGTNCNCAQTLSHPADPDTYTVSGSTMTWSDGSTSEFCATSSSMTLREPLVGDVDIIMTLAKQ